MPDIFISYSRKDSEQALQLAERLRASGVDVWIDQHGIEAAKSWSKEIVKAIDDSKAFVVLLSERSLTSKNVARELGIASEAEKPMLPVMLDDVRLSDEFRYHLSGIQRVDYTEFDAITAALHGFGIEPHKAQAGTPVPRVSLIVLPFDDLSPAQDNQWFADGLAGELIDSLTRIKSLKLLDRITSMGLRNAKESVIELARLFTMRYVVGGSVRKFGDAIKISVSLLDTETGEHLWQESYKGEMKDIFDLQESVAEQVVAGLKVHLTSEERSLLEARGTESAEAYEMRLKAIEYFNRRTRESMRHALEFDSEAIRIDPNYAAAYSGKASALLEMYLFNTDPALLDEAEALCEEIHRRRPDYLAIAGPWSDVLFHRGRVREAEARIREWVAREPENAYAHFQLGNFYLLDGRFADAIPEYEASLAIDPDQFASLGNICHCALMLGDNALARTWALRALPNIERHLRLHPDDEFKAVYRVTLLHAAGRDDEALAEVRRLTDRTSPDCVQDSASLLNAACALVQLGEKLEALRVFRRIVESGATGAHLALFLTDEQEGVPDLAGTPEYEEVKRMIEKRSIAVEGETLQSTSS
jgi:adenylate cyclase